MSSTALVSIDDERNVLGSILLDPRMLDQVSAVLAAEHFSDPLNASLYGLMLAHRETGKPVTHQALTEPFRRANPSDDAKGYLLKIAQFSPLAHHAKFYAERVRDRAKRRNWMLQAQRILDACQNPDLDLAAIDASANAACQQGLDYAANAQVDTVGTGLAEIAQQITRGEYAKRPGVEIGLPGVDRYIGGIRPGQLVTLAAPTGGHKSGFALSRLLAIAASTQRPTLYFSLEMLAREVEERALANLSGVSIGHFGEPNADEQARISDAAEFYADLPLYVVDKAMIRVSEIAAIARSMHWQHKFAAIVVDYIQLVEPDQPKDARHLQIGRITRVLKTLAMDLQVPIIALAQLNREYKGGRPTLAMLRESGSIEQDSNMVWFLWPEESVKGNDPLGLSEGEDEDAVRTNNSLILTVAKNRSGPVGADFKLQIQKGKFRYEEELSARMRAREEEARRDFGQYSKGVF